jgi:hypothetical protein
MGQLTPQALAGSHRPIPNEKRKNLSGLTTLGYPNTYLLYFQTNKGENFIHFDHGGWCRWQNTSFKIR